MPETNEYEASVELLDGVLNNGKSLTFPEGSNMTSLGKQICYGVVRDYYRLVFFRDSLVKKPSKQADLDVLLLCGLYSIIALKRPAHASVNAVVETTRKLQKPWARGFVNGVLRTFIRRRTELERSADNIAEAHWNHPNWLQYSLRNAWPDDADEIMSANNMPAPMTLRINVQKTNLAGYQQQLICSGLNATSIDGAPAALQLQSAVSVTRLPGFADGLVSVQDEASQLAAPLLQPQPGDKVLDACAAPGGKACHLLEIEPGIKLVAIDSEPDRIRQLHDNLHRLGLHCQTVTNDFLDYGNGKFDKILLDVPCSGTGIIRRHPDIKLLRRSSDIDKLATCQTELLNHAWELLVPGGTLLYSTCSVLPQENEQIVRKFVESRHDAGVIPVNIVQGCALKTGRQLFPRNKGHDGFYLSLLRKTDQ